MNIYLNKWKSFEEMANDFARDQSDEGRKAFREGDDFKGIEILLASYGTGNYEGDAFVLFRKGGKLFEVNGSHCSCYELEGQWRPEETTKEALQHRLEKGNLGSDSGYGAGNKFDLQLHDLLKTL